MKILGIDPSLRRTGWGLVKCLDNTIEHIAHGVIKTSDKMSTDKRLYNLQKDALELLANYLPDVICVEETYCGINPITTLKLGFASGALLSAIGSTNKEVFMYPTRKVKQIVTQNGSSSKDEVRDCVVKFLKLEDIDNLDSSDALAVAITHYLHLFK